MQLVSNHFPAAVFPKDSKPEPTSKASPVWCSEWPALAAIPSLTFLVILPSTLSLAW